MKHLKRCAALLLLTAFWFVKIPWEPAYAPIAANAVQTENADGSFTAVFYPKPINYFADGSWHSLESEEGKAYAATLTVNPDAGSPGTTSIDGFLRGGNGTYSTARNLATATATDDTSTTIQVENADEGGPSYQIKRAVTKFDTSALTANATISAATYSLYIITLQDGETDSLRLVTCTTAANTSLTGTDYATANWGTTALASDAALSGLSLNVYNDLSLNATGLSTISKTGVTTLCLRMVKDIAATQPSNINQMQARSSDNGSNQPKLVITYTLPATNFHRAIFMF